MSNSITRALSALRDNQGELHRLAEDIVNSNSRNAELAWHLALLRCSPTLLREYKIEKKTASQKAYTGHADLGDSTCLAEVKAKYLGQIRAPGRGNPDSDDNSVKIEAWVGSDVRNLRDQASQGFEGVFLICLASPATDTDKLEKVIQAWEGWGREVHGLIAEEIDLGYGDAGRRRGTLTLTIIKFSVP